MLGRRNSAIPEAIGQGLGISFSQSHYLMFALLIQARDRLAVELVDEDLDGETARGKAIAVEVQQMADASALAMKRIQGSGSLCDVDLEWFDRAIGNCFQISKASHYLHRFLESGADEDLDVFAEAVSEARKGVLGVLGVSEDAE